LPRGDSSQSPEAEDPEIQEMVGQFSQLRMRLKDKAVYYGPNSRLGIAQDFPEIWKGRRKEKGSCRELFKTIRELLQDETGPTGFPFAGVSVMPDFQALLPARELCDQLVGRYFECCNSLFNIIDSDDYWEQYPQLWSTDAPPPNSLIAITFFMIAIASRSLNDRHQLLPQVSSEGGLGGLKAAGRWKKCGETALSQNCLFRKSSIYNIQAVLLLSIYEGGDNVRWNLLGLVGNMARIAGLHRDPNVFLELEDKDKSLRR
jgi:hypothetical protein